MKNSKFKKLIAVLVLVVVVGACAGCSSKTKNEKPVVVCTIFPAYDIALNILGDKADSMDVHYLLENGADMHSFQPSASDIALVSSCDLLITLGGESDMWIEDALKNSTNKNMRVLKLIDSIGDNAKLEEDKEGMTTKGEEEEAYDEHIWLSPKNAIVIAEAIQNSLESLDSKNAEAYASNGKAYIEELKEVDKSYEEAVAHALQKTLLFADRFPFRYLTEDYGLDYYAAFPGCSAETEASFETIIFLAGKIDELSLKSVLVIENSETKLAETIINNTKDKNQEIFVLDSMQSVNIIDINAGKSYIQGLKNNLLTLQKALFCDKIK